jgi:DNA-binding transcriptional LysR family regulator
MITLKHGASLAETTAFVTVVELKSFTKAAKQLALSPPRVSEMVRNPEERLGVRLVERTTRSVAPTAAGERLLERLWPVLDEYQSALESTNEFRGKPAGMLRVTAPPPARHGCGWRYRRTAGCHRRFSRPAAWGAT